ncbi:hypothetical protein F2Q70_00024473 [Brassica cretica]|uniref:Uncharacterized protein n=1 Tax=Brassica cretica TaxID=69181 RepID=A0A8S9LD99_BRACR|nr:hypothetical protein F2Q70_00024473 [Brassica cretica]
MQRSVTRLVKPHNFIHPDDTLILEDETSKQMSFPWISTLQHVSDHVQILAPLMLIISDFLGLLVRTLTSTQEAESKLDFVERTLRWRHLAPTAPNTLG